MSKRSTRARGIADLKQVAALSAPRPAPDPFVGRERELRLVLRDLDAHHSAAVTGSTGSGKTALLATAAAVAGYPTVWVDLYPALNDRSESLLWEIAQPLATLAPETWHSLHQMQQEQWHYPLAVRLQLILGAYAAAPQVTLLCIDGIDDTGDRGLESLLVALNDHIARTINGRLKLLMAGRTLPYRIKAQALPALGGLALPAIAQWAAKQQVPLSDQEIRQIVEQTGGLPAAVELILQTLQSDTVRPWRGQIFQDRTLNDLLWHLLDPLAPPERELLYQLVTGTAMVPLPFERRATLAQLEDLYLATQSSNQSVEIHPLVGHFVQHRVTVRG